MNERDVTTRAFILIGSDEKTPSRPWISWKFVVIRIIVVKGIPIVVKFKGVRSTMHCSCF